MKWYQAHVNESFKTDGLFPLRPEQIRLGEAADGKLHGEILTRQFQGKEYHYSLDMNGRTVIVHLPIHESYEIGETVSIEPDII